MSMELPKAYDPALIEDKWANFWVTEEIFTVPSPAATPVRSATEASASATATPAPFVQLLPPPNVTGRLHMGHMLNQTEMDILTRWHRMSGDTALWVPGTDHAGIATQMMVERQLAAEGKSRTDFSREDFTARVWQWKQEYGSAITDQMKRLGASVDWSREYFTMDDRLSLAVREAFVRLFEQGLIYRGAYIVNWDPVLQTAVSDLEVESEERAGSIYHIRYDLADGTGSITIATTRPETLLGDTAVAVNPTDPRYTHLIGKLLKLPLSAAAGKPSREIPILADDWANPEFGTGAVKVTPAHDPNDFAIGQRHPEIGSLNILDTSARIDLPGSPYHGLDRFEARKRILADLESSGHLVAIKDHTLTLPISQRTGAVIEPRLSMQWFLKIQPLADKAIAAVEQGHITFTPDNYRKTYNEWMSNIHDWCISRQLWWGHRIPAWHCPACPHITISRSTPTACAACGSTAISQETDVLDTWFSSGLLPFTVFGWPAQQGLGMREQGLGSNTLIPNPSALTPDLQAFYPTQLLVTGFDILFFWVARMIMLGTHFMLDVPNPDGSPRTLAHAVPFRNVYIHALVRDADRQKMSKTKGNVIDPIQIVKKYGTDAVRFTLASQASPGTDIAFNEARTEGYSAFANKIWNATRFLFMNVERGIAAGINIDLTVLRDYLDARSTVIHPTERHPGQPATQIPEFDSYLDRYQTIESEWIRIRLRDTATSVEMSLKQYRFDEAASSIYEFFWGDFCDWYIEISKLRFEFEDPTKRKQCQHSIHTALAIYEASLRLLSPFMPFLTEELWHALYANLEMTPPKKSIALAPYPTALDFGNINGDEEAMKTLQSLITTLRGLRKDLAVPEKEPTPIQLHAGLRVTALAQAHADMLARLARVSSIELIDAPPSGTNARSTPSFDVALLYERQIDVPAERERLLKEIARYEKGLEAAHKQLSNQGFVARAPAHIVEGLKKQAAETQALLEKASTALAALPPDGNTAVQP